MKKQYRSRVMASVRETAEGLTAAGVMSKRTMREFDELCLSPEAPVTMREVLRLLLEADSYPRLGNEDWSVAARMEAAALKKPPPPWRHPTTRWNSGDGWKRCKDATSRSTSAKKYTGRSMTISARGNPVAETLRAVERSRG
jgi:hypothetical protein